MSEDRPPAPVEDWRGAWPALAELGITALCVPTGRGGFGHRVDAAAGVAVELGAALHGAPFAGLTAAAQLLASSDDPAAVDLLERVVAGEAICAFGLRGPGEGVVRAVDGADTADALVALDEASGVAHLFDEPRGWELDTSLHRFDVSRTCAEVTVAASPASSFAATSGATDTWRLLLAADSVGCVGRMLDRTVAYAGERMAFGRPIGGFQAVQHRLADHAVRARGLTLSVQRAARLLTIDAPEAPRAVALAELGTASAATDLLNDLVQLTGAIGFTWEYGLHFFERRTHQDARMAAAPRAAVRRLAELEGWSRGR